MKRNIYDLGKRFTGRDAWTIAVQHSLANFVVEKGWDARVLPPPNFKVPKKGKKYAFLLDFVIWRDDLAGKKEGAWLACESEWNISHHSVIEDFHKLMSFRAPYKLMIYDGNKGNGDLCHTEFKQALSGFRWHVEDEIYIFLEFVKGDKIARAYTCRPARNVRLAEVKDA